MTERAIQKEKNNKIKSQDISGAQTEKAVHKETNRM